MKIIQLLLIEQLKIYNLLMVVKLEFYEIVLHKHKRQRNLLIFKVIIDYDLKLLKENSMVQSTTLLSIKFDWIFVILKRKEKQCTRRILNLCIVTLFMLIWVTYKYLTVVT